MSAIPFRIMHSPLVLARGLVAHALLIDMPIAIFIRYFSTGRLSPAS